MSPGAPGAQLQWNFTAFCLLEAWITRTRDLPVGVNGYQLEPNSPFGGFRQSGLGREGGRAAVESYTELKTVLLPFTDEMM